MTPLYDMGVIGGLFTFWNKCNVVKFFPRRSYHKPLNKRLFIRRNCTRCDVEYNDFQRSRSRYRFDKWDSYLCPKCRIKILEEYNENCRIERQIEANNSFVKFKDLLETCEKGGTCDILSAHHELLSEDPERLSTDFLIGLICGDKKKDKYLKSKQEGVNAE